MVEQLSKGPRGDPPLATKFARARDVSASAEGHDGLAWELEDLRELVGGQYLHVRE
jgi:hypothetical protein